MADTCSLAESEERHMPQAGEAGQLPGLRFSTPSLGVEIPSCCFF